MPSCYPYEKMTLPYECHSLMPRLDPDTVYLHHSVIYGELADRFNALLKNYAGLQSLTLEELIINDIPTAPPRDKRLIKYYAGGLYNHQQYFTAMCAKPCRCEGELACAITARYGSLTGFKNIFKDAAQNVLGSGFVWLMSERNADVHIAITSNYRVPNIGILSPLLVLDVWEHAYYFKYPAQLDEYINAFWEIASWDIAEERYLKSLGKA